AGEDDSRDRNLRIGVVRHVGHTLGVQESGAVMAMKFERRGNMGSKVDWLADREASLRTRAALAKLYCARNAMEVIDDAIQIMVGLGYTYEARVSRFWLDVSCERIVCCTVEINNYVAGRQILKDYQNNDRTVRKILYGLTSSRVTG
ncbi:acyl-CoA dehydrogenase family protein, partial [Salmonella enterica]|uniref:acyl-CoA dehydrogenase family protein n=1 Tax=Salmonella enterica TaxID=28901 RepID=UPI00398C6C5E